MNQISTDATARPDQAPTTWTVTRNACKLCTPLGACLVFKGVRGAIPFMHGSQGCSTYIRRYLISHFREPVDIASSNFSEHTAVFGGGDNLHAGLDNVSRQYAPELIGVMTTCLSETIGDDVGALLKDYRQVRPGLPLPELVHVSTPSYSGTHAEGFFNAVQALVEQLAVAGPPTRRLNLFPGLVSPADLRHLKEVVADYGLEATVLPDYSETLDGGLWSEYQPIPPGGTSLADIRAAGSAGATLELGASLALAGDSAGRALQRLAGIPNHSLGLPIGIAASDRLFAAISELAGQPTPANHWQERSRLVDAYADGHKYLFERRVVVLGEEDLAVALAAFVAEIGMLPVVVASGGRSGRLRQALLAAIPELDPSQTTVADDSDMMSIQAAARAASAELIIGNSKAFPMSRELGLPLVRVGFPVHDRFGASRLLHLGYRGTQQLFDRLVNAILAQRQDSDAIGYSYY